MSLYMLVEGHKSSHVGSDPNHQGWIPLIGFELGRSRARRFSGNEEANQRVGQEGVKSITVQKELDSSTGFLAQAAAQGKELGEVLIDICETEKGKFVRRVMRYTIEETQIASYRVIRNEKHDHSFEEILLVGSKIVMERNL